MRRQDQPMLKPPRSDRPGEIWMCGNAELGVPCTHGPTPDGRCPGHGLCQPAVNSPTVASGSISAKCTRPTCHGGSCEIGPTIDGGCGMIPKPCRPVRTWYGRRRKARNILIAFGLGLFLVALGSPWRREFLAPGPLAEPHAQILGGALHNDRCAACHPAARGRLAEWFGTGKTGHANVTQSQLCIDCHHAVIQPERSLLSHNLNSDELRLVASRIRNGEFTWRDSMPSPSFASDDVQCATCHREHHGKEANLVWMENTQCQTCHKDRFASFSDGHPDWEQWPYGRGGNIAFNHTTHQQQHFTKGGKAFDCRSCHTVSVDGTIDRVASFEVACASCHNESLKLQLAAGAELLALPTLDIDAIRARGQDPGPWPEKATGSEPLHMSPLMRMLLVSEDSTRDAIEVLSPHLSTAWDGSPGPEQLAAMSTLADSIRRLMRGLSDDLHGELSRRLEVSDAPRFAGQLNPQLLTIAYERWFEDQSTPSTDQAQLNQRIPMMRLAMRSDESVAADPLLEDLLDDPLLESDPLAEELQRPSNGRDKNSRFDPDTMLPDGGWYCDEVRLAIRYRGAGHVDPVMRALIETASSAQWTEDQRASILAIPAVAACMECHPKANGATPLSWHSLRRDSDRRTFTKFSHRPHMNIQGLADCTHCHQVGTHTTVPTEYSGSSQSTFAVAMPIDFLPMQKQTCSNCHTRQAAGDSCTKCHSYHVDPPL